MPARIYPKKPLRLFIAEWREKTGLTQKRLGDLLDVSDVTVSRWETGERRPSLDVLAALAEALGRQPEDFYRHPDRPSADELLRDQPVEVVDQAMRVIRAMRR